MVVVGMKENDLETPKIIVWEFFLFLFLSKLLK
jgi:hypothetical protein